MQIIADAGASKTDWRFIYSDRTISQAKTNGINAYHISKEELLLLLTAELRIPKKETVNQVFFYGAGCGSTDNKEKIKTALQTFFKADSVEVEHDLLAAARATCLKEEGISCILGTGANACVYDGESISSEMVSLGYVLGDEGSGAYIGKLILKAYLERELPKKLMDKFSTAFPQLSAETVNHQLYQKPYPNRYLAQFFSFAIKNQQEKYIHELLKTAFQKFLEKSVLKFEEKKHLPVHFVGGVAYHSNSIIRKLVQENSLTMGKFLESPIAGLTLYHLNKHL